MELILKYFPDLSPEQCDRFAAMYDLYADWNAKINVVSRKDFDQLYLRHVLHSLAIARVCRFDAGARILDVGCGGGFPSGLGQDGGSRRPGLPRLGAFLLEGIDPLVELFQSGNFPAEAFPQGDQGREILCIVFAKQGVKQVEALGGALEQLRVVFAFLYQGAHPFRDGLEFDQGAVRAVSFPVGINVRCGLIHPVRRTCRLCG